MKYNVYRIHLKTKYRDSYAIDAQEHHRLELLKRLDSLIEAEAWIKDNHESWVNYTILPVYHFTPFDEE